MSKQTTSRPGGRSRRLLASAVIAVVAASTLAACGDDAGDSAGAASGPSGGAASVAKDAALAAKLPKDIASSGKLNVAISLAYKPMEYSDAGSTTLKGADIELAKAVGEKLGVKINFQNVEFEQLIPSATTHRADLIWTAISDLTKRHGSLDFVDYFKTGDQLFIPQSQAGSLKTPADLCGKTVVVATGTSWIQTVKDISAKDCVGKSPIKQITVPSLSEELLQIQQGRAQASMVGLEGVGDLQLSQPGRWAKLGQVYNPGYYGVAFAKDRTELRDVVKSALDSLLRDGTYLKILAKYGLQNSALTTLGLNQGK